MVNGHMLGSYVTCTINDQSGFLISPCQPYYDGANRGPYAIVATVCVSVML